MSYSDSCDKSSNKITEMTGGYAVQEYDSAEYPLGTFPHQRVWEDESGNRWLVTAFLGRVDGRIEVTGMEVRSFARERESHLQEILTPAKLTTSIWRRTYAFREALRLNYKEALKDQGLLAGTEHETIAMWDEIPSVRRAGHATVAELHDRARLEGRQPAAFIAKEMNISESAASKRIQRAREAAYLPPARRGRPGRESR